MYILIMIDIMNLFNLYILLYIYHIKMDGIYNLKYFQNQMNNIF